MEINLANRVRIGDYVRTKDDGLIKKVIKVEYDDCSIIHNFSPFIFNTDKGEKLRAEDLEDIFSSQIIDLIKVGDFVNGYKVLAINYDADDDYYEGIELDRNNSYEYQFISKRNIKTILTKEQYEQNCYNVGDNNG